MASKLKLKKLLLTSGIFTLGVLSGFVLSSLLFSKSIPPRLHAVRVSLAGEENFRATREERNGNIEKALTHQRNAVTFSSPEYIATFDKYCDENLFSPFAYLLLDKVVASSGFDNARNEALYRSSYAYLLEKNGAREAAEKEWKNAARLMGHNDIDKVKSMTEYLMKMRDEPSFIKAENTVLGVE